ncbi:MAG: carboxylesterase [Planctomycetes bacterium]|nr:carboxylesterase [Planctomycetota bacterium]
MSELLSCVEIDPPGPHRASVVWLHGLGADGHDFEPIVPELGLPRDHGIRFVFPHAPSIAVTLNMGMVMPAWYDIQEIDLRRRHDEDGIRESAARIRALLEREKELGVPSERIVLAGFSQGGAIALFEGLRHPERLAGILALSTYLVLETGLDAERSLANHGVPVLQMHGTHDPVVVLERGEHCRDVLLERGYPVEWHTYPMPHSVHPRQIVDIGVWLRARLGERPV